MVKNEFSDKDAFYYGKNLERPQRSACRYLEAQGIDRQTLCDLFHKRIRAIKRACENEMGDARRKDSDPRNDLQHVPAELQRRVGESPAEFCKRIRLLAVTALGKGTREKVTKRAPARTGISSPDISKKRTISSGRPHRVSRRGLPDAPPLRSPSIGLGNEDDRGSNDIVTLPHRPIRASVNRAQARWRRAPLSSDATADGREDSKADIVDTAPPSDQSHQNTSSSTTHSSTRKRGREDDDEDTDEKKPFKRSKSESPSKSFGLLGLAKVPMMEERTVPISAIIREKAPPSPDGVTARNAVSPRKDQSTSLPNSGPSRPIFGIPNVVPRSSQLDQPLFGWGIQESVVLSSLERWLRPLRLDHFMDLFREVGFITMEDARDAAAWDQSTQDQMMAKLRQKGMLDFETWRLQAGLRRLKLTV